MESRAPISIGWLAIVAPRRRDCPTTDTAVGQHRGSHAPTLGFLREALQLLLQQLKARESIPTGVSTQSCVLLTAAQPARGGRTQVGALANHGHQEVMPARRGCDVAGIRRRGGQRTENGARNPAAITSDNPATMVEFAQDECHGTRGIVLMLAHDSLR